jgi:hypothetical protein
MATGGFEHAKGAEPGNGFPHDLQITLDDSPKTHRLRAVPTNIN